MPISGTDYSGARRIEYVKKRVPLPVIDENSDALVTGTIVGTAAYAGSYYGCLLIPYPVEVSMYWNTLLPLDWDGTSSVVFRWFWTQWPGGDLKDATAHFNFRYWVVQDYFTAMATKVSEATYTCVYGDEGTNSFGLHCGTFEMDLTGGTFGTVSAGHRLFMELSMHGTIGVSWATACMIDAYVEYSSWSRGWGLATRSEIDKRGS